jgi:hypothetical protein
MLSRAGVPSLAGGHLNGGLAAVAAQARIAQLIHQRVDRRDVRQAQPVRLPLPELRITHPPCATSPSSTSDPEIRRLRYAPERGGAGGRCHSE